MSNSTESRKITFSNDVFFGQVISLLRTGGTVTVRVKGFSMFPFIRNDRDSVCLTKYDGTPLKRGQVILFSYMGKYILHRIVKAERSDDGRYRYTTLGDGNLSGTETARPENIYGIMTKRIAPSGREWNCDSFSWKFLSSLWMRLRPARRYLLAVLRRIYR